MAAPFPVPTPHDLLCRRAFLGRSAFGRIRDEVWLEKLDMELL